MITLESRRLLLAFAIALPGTALAQPATNNLSDRNVKNLPDLVINATRNKSTAGETPQKTTIITREQIEQQQAISNDPGQILSNLIPSFSFPGWQR